MSGGTFFPNDEAGQVVWLSHYALKLPVHGPVCGIPPDEINTTLTDIQYYIWLLQQWHPVIQHYAKEATAYKAIMIGGNPADIALLPKPVNPPDMPVPPPAGIQRRLFSQIARIKAALTYNESIGLDLGVVATPSSAEHPVPEYTLTVEMGEKAPRVRVDFKKHGHDGIWIESRVNGGDWAFLAIDTVKPYYDESPLSPDGTLETREYRLRWWDKSQPHGERSAVQRVIVGG